MKAKFSIGDIVVKFSDNKIGKIAKMSRVKMADGKTRMCYRLKGSDKCYYSFELKKG
jgi:hypothetical protein